MKKYGVREIICTAVLITFIVALLITQSGGTKKSLSEVSSAPLSTLGVKKMTEKTTAQAAQTFGFDADKTEECVYYSCDDIMNVSEILIVKVKDKNDIKDFEKSVGARVDAQENLFRNYAPSQYALLKSSVIKSSGNMLFYCTAKNSREVYQAYKKAL